MKIESPKSSEGRTSQFGKKFNSRLIQYLMKKSPGKKLIKRKQQTYGNLTKGSHEPRRERKP